MIRMTDLGREGAIHMRQQIRNREMAEQLAEMDDISVSRAQKMIQSSIDAQRKANLAKRSRNRTTNQ